MEDKEVKPIVLVWWLTVFVFIGVRLFLGKEGGLAYVQTVFIALTFFTLVWYTFATHRMQQAMVKQTQLSILPVFRFSITPEREAISLRNIGNGVALDVRVDPIFIQYFVIPNATDDSQIGRMVSFDSYQDIAPTTYGRFEDYRPFNRDHPVQNLIAQEPKDIFRYLEPETALRDYKIIIHFRDVVGNSYRQSFKIAPGELSAGIVEQEKK